MALVYIGLGTNIHPRFQYLRKGVTGVMGIGVALQAISSLYITSPVGNENQPYFLNAVVSGETSLSPQELFKGMLEVEKSCGRVRDQKWGPRTLDLDLLLYDNIYIRTDLLTIPHPRIAERKFVLMPLVEISPEIASPEGKLYKDCLSLIDSSQKIRKMRKKWLDGSLSNVKNL